MVLRRLECVDGPTSVWNCLEDYEPPIDSLQLGSTENTEPTEDKIHIPRELIGDWNKSPSDPFPDFDGIIAYAQEDPQVWQALQTNIKNDEWNRVLTQREWALNGENILEMMLKTTFDIVNLALETTTTNGKPVLIQGGKSATAGNREAGIKSEPDRASFFAPATQDGSAYVYFLGELDYRGSKKLRNIIPGEIKLYYKFRRVYIDATTSTWDAKRKIMSVKPDHVRRNQAEQVFTQIYQYMNERHAAVGYLMTDQELICIRRTSVERCGFSYGVIDISPAIPLSIRGSALNAKLALWYLHHKYAVRHPHLNILPRTLKPRNWRTAVVKIRNARVFGSDSAEEARQRFETLSKGNCYAKGEEVKTGGSDEKGLPSSSGRQTRSMARVAGRR